MCSTRTRLAFLEKGYNLYLDNCWESSKFYVEIHDRST